MESKTNPIIDAEIDDVVDYMKKLGFTHQTIEEHKQSVNYFYGYPKTKVRGWLYNMYKHWETDQLTSPESYGFNEETCRVLNDILQSYYEHDDDEQKHPRSFAKSLVFSVIDNYVRNFNDTSTRNPFNEVDEDDMNKWIDTGRVTPNQKNTIWQYLDTQNINECPEFDISNESKTD